MRRRCLAKDSCLRSMRMSAMRLPTVLILPAALLFSLPAFPAENEQKTGAAGIDRLIAQLGSAEFDKREAASIALEQAGAAALPALQQAGRSADAEVRRRSEDLIPRIERRLETARLLAPKRLRLVYKDTPIADAV